MLSRTTSTAFAAMSYLAQAWADEGRRVTAGEIAADRGLSKTFVAKVLTVLSQFKFITGAPGPGGGYRLARDPSTINLKEISSLFERDDEMYHCPFGPQYCQEGQGPPCPLHDKIVHLRETLDQFLGETWLSEFTEVPQQPDLP